MTHRFPRRLRHTLGLYAEIATLMQRIVAGGGDDRPLPTADADRVRELLAQSRRWIVRMPADLQPPDIPPGAPLGRLPALRALKIVQLTVEACDRITPGRPDVAARLAAQVDRDDKARRDDTPGGP